MLVAVNRNHYDYVQKLLVAFGEKRRQLNYNENAEDSVSHPQEAPISRSEYVCW